TVARCPATWIFPSVWASGTSTTLPSRRVASRPSPVAGGPSLLSLASTGPTAHTAAPATASSHAARAAPIVTSLPVQREVPHRPRGGSRQPRRGAVPARGSAHAAQLG